MKIVLEETLFMNRDGHIHTPYCPHGTTDTLVSYIEKAISGNFSDITFTEHAPLPENFIDPTPEKDSGMDPKLLIPYFKELQSLKKDYSDRINIRIGLEVDFILGYEEETSKFLNTYGHFLDDAILSVHFLPFDEEYTCIDFSPEEFLKFCEHVGSVEQVYNLYYDTIQKSIDADLGAFKPKRIGHPTLIHKFQHAHKQFIDDTTQIQQVLQHIKEAGYEMDLNSAGLSKAFCKEPYPPYDMIAYAKEIKLPMVFGSDAHCVNDLHQHYNKIYQIKTE